MPLLIIIFSNLSTTRSNIRILVIPAIENDVKKGKGKNKSEKDIFTKNIVYKEVLTT